MTLSRLVAAGLLVVPAAVAAHPVAQAAAPSPRYVVAISLDGLNPQAMRSLGRAEAPNLWRMVDEGASTLNARTAYERTDTLPNHTGMVTGRRIEGPTGHHITFNEDHGSTVAQEAGRYVPSVFDVVHDRGRRTALFSGKDKLDVLNRSWGRATGAPDTVGVDDGRDKIDRYVRDDSAANTSRLVTRLREGRPRAFSLLHIALPDLAGHEHGYMTPAYLAAVAEADRLVGRVLTAARSSKRMRNGVHVIVTADHGGPLGQTSHSDATLPANYTIPFLVWGPGVKPGTNLYSLNPERTSPGTGRPGYSASPPIRNTDVAGLAARLLRVPVPKGSLLPRTTSLEVR